MPRNQGRLRSSATNADVELGLAQLHLPTTQPPPIPDQNDGVPLFGEIVPERPTPPNSNSNRDSNRHGNGNPQPPQQRRASGSAAVPVIIFAGPDGFAAPVAGGHSARPSASQFLGAALSPPPRSARPLSARSAWEQERENVLGLRTPRTSRQAPTSPTSGGARAREPPQPQQHHDLKPVDVPAQHGDKSLSSAAAVVCLWNMIITCVILTTPWCFALAGIVPATIITVVLALVNAATCTMVVDHGAKWGSTNYANICGEVLGPLVRYVYLVMSMVTNVGFATGYHRFITGSGTDLLAVVVEVSPKWVALVAGAVLFLLYTGKSVYFFVRARELGAVAVAFVAFFILYAGTTSADALNEGKPVSIPWFPEELSLRNLAPLTGVVSGQFMFHNCVLPSLVHNKEPHRHNTFVWVACLAACAVILVMGIVPNLFLDGELMRNNQNFLGAFSQTDTLACVARVVIIVQFMLNAPMYIFLTRLEFFGAVLACDNANPSRLALLTFTGVVTAVSIFFVLVVPGVGDIIRWVGAMSGFVMSYSTPPLIAYASRVLCPEPTSSWFRQYVADMAGMAVLLLGLFILGMQLARS